MAAPPARPLDEADGCPEAARLLHRRDSLRLSPPATSSPSSPPARPVADRAATPLSLLPGSASRARHDPFAAMSPAETPEPAVSPVAAGAAAVAAPTPAAPVPPRRVPAAPVPAAAAPVPAAPVPAAAAPVPAAPAPERRVPERRVAVAPSPPAVPAPRPGAGVRLCEPPTKLGARMTHSPPPPPDSQPPSPLSSSPPPSPLPDARPLRTARVRPDTALAHPKPIARAAPVGQLPADLGLRAGPPLGSIAQLEATAERLSMTSSIDDAIRDLHAQLKRSDSRRSSLLAAYLRSSATDALGTKQHFLSTSSSIVSTNIAARHGGYSPAAYVMSPNHSLSGPLASGSRASAARPDAGLDAGLDAGPSRHGPAHASLRSARSIKMSLAEISESEPVALTQRALDEADAAPPIEHQIDESTLMLPQHDDDASPPSTGASEPLPRHHGPARTPPLAEAADQPAPDDAQDEHDKQRPTSAHSNSTFQQCRDAFTDFDGVHCEPENEHGLFVPPALEPDLPTPRAAPTVMQRPQSYIDAETGQQMLYYPARVPAMLNLPPKLSNKVKIAQRNQRRSQILSAMMETNSLEAGRRSAAPEPAKSWLPDPIAGHRGSFSALSYEPLLDLAAKSDRGDAAAPELEPEAAADELPPLSSMDPSKRKTKFLSSLPPQLRASAFFDLPSVPAEVKIKDGSATAALDSILDAAATAPVSVFTDNVFATEVFGKKKKIRASRSTAALDAFACEPEPESKKRSSLMWLGKRSNSHDSADKKRPRSTTSGRAADADGESGDGDARARSPGGGGQEKKTRAEAAKPEDDEESDQEDESYHGPPTTLLAELQLRKQEQQLRKKNFGGGFPNGMHATLLEMDAVAETQAKHRKSKRVNLAWEEPDEHVDQNGSDDEDVPLAILAAMQQGAKNRADLERPMGLMERRELEDNEPLSHRRARLQGLEPPPVILPKHQSVMSFPAFGAAHNRSPHSAREPSPGLGDDEIEGETLGARRRRLATHEGSDGDLPRARPVSSAFSAELLSQFGDPDQAKDKAASRKENTPPKASPGKETLGQRRRRLQAEREAREREMNHGNPTGEPAQRNSQRVSMADILAAHPKKEADGRAQEEKRRAEEKRAAREREAKLAAMRKQMPQSLDKPPVDRSGGFQGGAFNDGTGGCGPQASRSSLAVNTLGLGQGPYGNYNHDRSSGLLGTMYGSATNGVNKMGAYGGMNTMGFYNGGTAMGLYGGGVMAPGMQVPMPMGGAGSMDRVEQWRRSVHP